jgi:general secretion pathway protein C
MSTASWLEGFRPSDHWRALIAHRGPGVVVGVLALALAAQTALLVTDLAGGSTLAAPPLSVWHPHPSGPDLASVAAAHLFGVAPQSAEADGDDVPSTRLPLVLTGVLAARDPAQGLAILGPNAASAKVYAVGDTIPGGARLDAVLPRKVLLRHNGVVRSLALPQQTPPGAAPPSAGALPPTETSAPQFVARMRSLVAHRPGIVAELLRPEPVFSGGHQLGYRVYPGNDPQAFRSLGLKSGDLVLAINGTALNDPAQDQQILNTLDSSSEATVTVLRNGQQRNLTLNLAQVEQAAQSVTRAQESSPAHPRGPPAVPFGNAPQAPPPR